MESLKKRTATSQPLIQQQISLLLSSPKDTIRPMEWQQKPGNKNPHWLEFFSACEINSTTVEGLIFRAQYRASKSRISGGSVIEMPETYSFGIHMETHRVAAIDYSDTPHTNKKGRGRPYFNQQISGYHKHIWTEEGYGYAEPITNGPSDINELAKLFQAEFCLVILDGFVHPLHGTQLVLPI